LTLSPFQHFLRVFFTERQYYRLYTIHSIPSLKCLDYLKVKKAERLQAERLAHSAAGAALESDVQQQQQQSSSSNSNTVKTFTPGESADGSTVVTLFTAAEKEAIRHLLANAASVAEVEEIENAVQRGVLPDKLLQGVITAAVTPNHGDTNGEDQRDDNDPKPTKRLKV
jgi:hypothetical protein